MAGAGYKTFTAGEVLTASDVNTYLMQQSVQNYGGTAARSSAIPTPSTGMTSYVATTPPQVETYTGSAWQNMSGLVLLNTTPVSAQANVTISNVFTSSYQNYQIELVGTSSSLGGYSFQLTAGGTPSAVSYYGAVVYRTATTQNSYFNTNSTSGVLGYIADQSNLNILTISNPAATIASGYLSQYMGFGSTGSEAGTIGGMHYVATSYDGIKFTFTGNFTGTIRIYGLRNS